jgi:hypothetical protein
MKKNRSNHKKPKAPDALIALDLGEKSIKAVLVRRKRSGCSIEGYQEIAVASEDKTPAGLLRFALTTLEGTFLRKTKNITVGIGGHECRISIRDLPAADPSDLRRVIRKAPAQIFNEDFEKLTFDCFGLSPARDISQGQDKKRKTLITAIPREASEALQTTAFDHGCKLMSVTVSQISTIEAIARVFGASAESIGTLDVGFGTSTLSFIQNGELVFVRSCFETSRSLGQNPIVLGAELSGGIASLASEVRSSLDYIEHNFGSLPSVIYITGATAQNRPILDLLQQEIGIELKAFDALPEIRINTDAAVTEIIKKSLTQLIPAITEGERLLQSNDGLNLLAERDELQTERNSNSLRTTIFACTALIAAVVGWGGFQHVRAGQIEQEIAAKRFATSKLTKKAEEAVAASVKVAETRETLNAITGQAKARFLFGPALSAMQELPLNNIELQKLKIQEEVVQTAVSRAYTNHNKKAIAALPARTIMRNTLVLEAKQPGSASVEPLLTSIKEQQWFRTSLRRVDPVLLKELITQSNDGSKEAMLRVEAYAEKVLQ